MRERPRNVGTNGVAHLSGLLFDPIEFKELMCAVGTHGSLRVLSLEECIIGDDGAREVAKLMRDCSTR